MVKANDCRALKHLINFATHYLNRKLHTNEFLWHFYFKIGYLKRKTSIENF